LEERTGAPSLIFSSRAPRSACAAPKLQKEKEKKMVVKKTLKNLTFDT
jgi:hypothetical protein